MEKSITLFSIMLSFIFAFGGLWILMNSGESTIYKYTAIVCVCLGFFISGWITGALKKERERRDREWLE